MDRIRSVCIAYSPIPVRVVPRTALWPWVTSQQPYFIFGEHLIVLAFSQADPFYFMVSSGKIRRL